MKSAPLSVASLLALVWACIMPLSCAAEDVIYLQGADPAKGAIPDFKITVFDEALKRTRKHYGPYRYVSSTLTFSRDRMLEELQQGTQLNVAMVVTQPSWEEKLIPVRIPIDMGLSGLRISLIRADAQGKLGAVRSVEDLKALRMGVGAAWSSRKVADAGGFEIVPAENYDSLLKMLSLERSDYFPRSLNEAFSEYDALHAAHPEIAIDRALLLNLPLPTYVFVSPKAPRLAKRIEEGMESMVRDGTLRKLMLQFNADVIRRAALCERLVLQIPNPLLPEGTPLARKELWFDPFDEKTGICAKSGGHKGRRSNS
ncbi:hypothetical protein VVD49_14305 [Uliginosibacterium sp. H3]|uniref:Solute-binding protein family 3/N-terminal domain-containing protein n=1 Tax=Uliginosibacterium silvisoli TaxID=3114758 RepID=A0ABU6K524_9RHOO|nr:hypothetical protein [Uliginosibacterium sp. H3]